MPSSCRTAEEMFPLVERYLRSHSPQKDFCRDHSVSTSVFNYWLAKYRRQSAAPREAGSDFIEIHAEALSADRPLLEIVYPHGVRLRLFTPVAPAVLERLVMPGQPR